MSRLGAFLALLALCGCGSGTLAGGCQSDYGDWLNVRTADSFWNPGDKIATFLSVLRRPQRTADTPPTGTSFYDWSRHTPFASGGGRLALSSSRRAWSRGSLSVFVATIPSQPDAICTEAVLDGKDVSARCDAGDQSAYRYDLAQIDCDRAVFIATVPADTARITLTIASRAYPLAVQNQVAAAILTGVKSDANATITVRSTGVPAVRTHIQRSF